MAQRLLGVAGMSPLQAIKLLERGQDLDEPDACRLLSALLDRGCDDLELGALLALLERKPVVLPELLGYGAALAARCSRLKAPPGPARPVVLPCYRGVRDQPNLVPLIALVLQRFGVPVLAHGALDGGGGVAAAGVFRELGVPPAASLAQAQAQLDERRLAFVPAAVLMPGLAALLALKGRLGFGGFADALARMLAPFGGEALHVAVPAGKLDATLLRDYFVSGGAPALLLEGVEGEAFADPQRRPAMRHVAAGECRLLFDPEAVALRGAGRLPPPGDAAAAAAWIRRALAGEAPLPVPLVNQAACCLHGAGYTDDMIQAKAIVAVATGSLAAA